jgi:hypothetical protein
MELIDNWWLEEGVRDGLLCVDLRDGLRRIRAQNCGLLRFSKQRVRY